MIRHYYARSSRPQQAALLLLVIGLLALGQWALAAPQFPDLTGRVVDNAELLSTSEHERLTSLLAEHESQTTNQVVVVTLKSLQGYGIEDFGYQLGRHWGIGQEGKDNGVLLVVAPNERKVRIEVGYGLEGTLTDALSRDIIEARILPSFKNGNYEAGVQRGTEGILSALAGTYQVSEDKWSDLGEKVQYYLVIFLMFGLLGFALYYFRDKVPGRHEPSSESAYNDYNDHGSGFLGGGSSFGGGGSSFGGGGGSFGGGGASGGW